jgi:ribonuclease I
MIGSLQKYLPHYHLDRSNFPIISCCFFLDQADYFSVDYEFQHSIDGLKLVVSAAKF